MATTSLNRGILKIIPEYRIIFKKSLNILQLLNLIKTYYIIIVVGHEWFWIEPSCHSVVNHFLTGSFTIFKSLRLLSKPVIFFCNFYSGLLISPLVTVHCKFFAFIPVNIQLVQVPLSHIGTAYFAFCIFPVIPDIHIIQVVVVEQV